MGRVEFLNSVYQNLFGRDMDDEGEEYWIGQLDAGRPVGGISLDTINGARNTSAGQDLTVVTNKLAVANYYTEKVITENATWTLADDQADAQDVLADVNSTAASVASGRALADTLVAADTAPAGQTFALTEDVEDMAGGAGADTFNTIVQTGATTWNTGDSIDGGAGNDTLYMRIIDVQEGENNDVSMSGVEHVRIRNFDNGAAADPIDASDWEGVTSIENYRSAAPGAFSADVIVEGVQNNVTLKSTDLVGSALEVTFANDALDSDEATLALEVDGSAGDFVVTVGGDDSVSTLSIKASGDDSDIGVRLYADTGTGLVDDEIENLVVTGDAALDLLFLSNEETTVISINASGNSGGLTFDARDVVAIEELTGSSGDDSIILASSADEAVIALGGGDDALDVITLHGGALGADVSIDLGAGDDTLTGVAGDLDDAASIVGGAGTDTISSVLIAAANRAAIAGFEKLDIEGESRSIDMTLSAGNSVTGLVISDALGGDVTISGLAGTAITVEVGADTGAGNDLTATLKTSTGSSDKATITFDDASTGYTVNKFASTSLESIAIVSDGGAGTNVLSAISDTANTLATITITGDQDFTLSDVDTNTTSVASSSTNPTANVTAALTLIDGSAATGNLTINAGTRTAYTDTTTGTFYFQYGSLTIKGGSGDDDIDHLASSGGTVYSYDGDDTVLLDGSSQIAYLGDGADTVAVSNSGQTIYVGADEDVDTVTVEDDSAFTTTGAAFSSSSKMTTIYDLASDDVIDLSNVESATNDPVEFDVSSYMSFVDAVNGAIQSADQINFFEWADGNTYIVVDGDVTAGEDAVLKLIGTGYEFDGTNGVITIV